MKTFISWNVNGIRAVAKKGFFEWFAKTGPDFLCLQETKAHEDQLTMEFKILSNYTVYFCSGVRRGYSGTAIYAKEPALNVSSSIDDDQYDHEGRHIILEYKDFFLCNIYFPNGRMNAERLKFKMGYYAAFLKFLIKLKATGKHVIICGDVNTAHREIDLAHPKENEKYSGFLPGERAWLDELLAAGFIDTFRSFNSNPEQYTWWDQKSRARERNVGWRIDYFFINKDAQNLLKDATIMPEVMGSDHCPIKILLDV